MEQKEKVTRKQLLEDVAQKSGVDVAVVNQVYNSLVDCIVNMASEGNHLSLTGFGNFYRQTHKGHPVQFESPGSIVPDYALLKFSASDTINKRLRP